MKQATPASLRPVDLVERRHLATAGPAPAERMFDHYRPAFNRCSPFFPLFRRPAYGRAAEKWKERRTGLREGIFLVAKQSLRWGRPSGGGTRSTGCKPAGVHFSISRKSCKISNRATWPIIIDWKPVGNTPEGYRAPRHFAVRFFTIVMVPAPTTYRGVPVMKARSQAFGKRVALRRFGLVAATACGVLAGLCITACSAGAANRAKIGRPLRSSADLRRRIPP